MGNGELSFEKLPEWDGVNVKFEVFNSTGDIEQDDILSRYPKEQQIEIQDKQRQLSVLAYFIGKDFEIPVLLNEPGGGWYWSQDKNLIKIDPDDLLKRPIEYLRHVVCHEGGHRRISKIIGVIPEDVWTQPGFSFLNNIVEDGRNDNFITEAYPDYREQTKLFFETQENDAKLREGSVEKIGYVPKHIQAGFELLKQWFREYSDKEFEVDESLPEDVKDFVKKTFSSAQDYWWKYPTKLEANNEDTVTQYAKECFDVNYNSIWPGFKELVDKDIEFQKKSETLNELSNGDSIPKDLEENLTEDEKKELQDKIDSNKENSDLSSKVSEIENMSQGLQEKILEHFEKQAEEKKKQIIEKIIEMLKDLHNSLNEYFQAKMISDDEEDFAEFGVQEPSKEEDEKKDISVNIKDGKKDTNNSRKLFKEAMDKGQSFYEKTRNELLPIIEELENELRDIFTARRESNWESGKRQGKRLNIEKRIQEKAKGVSAFESKSWETRTLPQEKDYDFSVLIDLSGSMRTGNRIQEAFKSLVVLAEVFNRLSINLEINGFNRDFYMYKKFDEELTDSKRNSMSGVLREVRTENADYNDDGWAVLEASKRLRKQKGSEQFLIVLSDGQPVPSWEHSSKDFELGKVVRDVTEFTNQKVIGLGIDRNTEHVSRYYPINIPNITTKDLPKTLSTLIRDLIAGTTSV